MSPTAQLEAIRSNCRGLTCIIVEPSQPEREITAQAGIKTRPWLFAEAWRQEVRDRRPDVQS